MTARQEKSVTIEHVHAVTPGRDLGTCGIRMAEGRIVAIGSDVRPCADDEVLDGTGLTAVPGFVDIHSHGRSGSDFCDMTERAFETIGRDKLQDGVTGFLATGLTRPEDELAEMCRCAERYKAKGDGAECLGVHLEGPFFNREMAGAQNPKYLKDPDAGFVLRLDAICGGVHSRACGTGNRYVGGTLRRRLRLLPARARGRHDAPDPLLQRHDPYSSSASVHGYRRTFGR